MVVSHTLTGTWTQDLLGGVLQLQWVFQSCCGAVTHVVLPWSTSPGGGGVGGGRGGVCGCCSSTRSVCGYVRVQEEGAE